MNVTTTLLLSLIQDVNTLNQLLEDIAKAYETNSIKSWLFPSKPHDIVSKIIICNKSFKNASYEKVLEVTLDRLYVLINFFLQYIHNFENVSGNNVVLAQPRKSTLGLCLKLLWNKIQKLIMEKETKRKTTAISGSHICSSDDKETQTEIISMNTCDSCSSAIVCMKRLLKSFDNQQDKIKHKYQLFDITQFGCMLKVTSSIEEALNSLYTRLHQEKIENNILTSNNESFKAKLHEKDARIAFLEEEVNILRRQLDRSAKNILELRQEQGKLTENLSSKRNQINNLNETVQNFRISLECITKQNNTLRNENNVLKSNVEKSIELLSRYSAKFGEKMSKLDKEYDVIKAIINQYENSISFLNIKLMKITKNIGKTELKVKTSFEGANQALQDFSKYQLYCVKIKDVFREKINKYKSEPEVTPIKGNPVEDITKQIEENRKKIENLEEENVRLQELLNRFKHIKLTK